MSFGHAGGHRAHPDLGNQLHMDPTDRVGVLQVVDELREIFDGVDVVVRRWRNQSDSRSGVPGAGDPGIHLVAGQLSALPGLGTLSHLDLEVVGVDQVFTGYAKSPRGHLFDSRPTEVAVEFWGEPVRILTALSSIRLPTDTVHSDGQGLVGFGTDRSVGHGPGGEPLDDLADRLDFRYGDGRPKAVAKTE